MRYYPAALALSLVLAMQASASYGTQREADPRAAGLLASGDAAMATGDTQAAIDAYEAALVIDPALPRAYISLGDAARARGMPGLAIHFYRQVLIDDPRNIAALTGEGYALVERGARERAERNLATVQALCGSDCAGARQLAAAIEAGPSDAVLTAEAVTPQAEVTQN